MPQLQLIKSVFNGGEMSPLMDGRTDSEKYATGCRLLENFIVRPYGGVFKRPGTRYGVQDANTTDIVRLIPFRRSTDINFVLGFGLNFIRVYSYSNGAFTLVTSITTTYTLAECRALHYCQLNDTMHLTVATKHPRVITRANDGTWSIIDAPFQFAPALDPPSDGVTVTLVYDAASWVTLTSYSVGDFVLYLNELYRCKTANSDAAFTIAKWDKAVYRSPWNVGQSYVAGDVTEYFGSNYFCITAHTALSANRPGVGAQWVLISITDYRLIASSATFDANEVGSTWLLSPGSTNRVTTENIPTGAGTTTSAAIFIQGAYTARTLWTTGNAPVTTFQLQESLDRINFTPVKEWIMATVNEGTISYTSEAPSTGAWYRWVSIKPGVSGGGASAYMTIEPATGQLDIPFLIQSYTSTTEVKGIPKLAVDSLIPNEVIGVAFPVWRKGAFSASRGYPRTVAFHDSRLWYACTSTEPMRMWGSQTDDFYNFLLSEVATSALDLTLAATQANDIQWITSFKRTMVIGTTGEEWTLDSGEQDTSLAPDNARLRRWSRYGSSTHQPILAGDALLWLTRDNRLREFAYVFEKDGYSAPEMTLLAEHIPSVSPVVQISFSQSPDPIVWLVHADGTWSGFTYDRDNNVTAWHRHNTGTASSVGKCKSLCTLYSSDTAADSLIFLVERNSSEVLESIDGAVMLAAMTSTNPLYDDIYVGSTPALFCDSYVQKSGTYYADSNTTIIQNVSVANPTFVSGVVLVVANQIGVSPTNSDGSLYEATVDGSGYLTVPGNFASGYVIGIPYTAAIIPNRVEIQLQDGTSQMRKWRLTRVSFRLFRSMKGNFQAIPTYTTVSTTERGSTSTASDTAIDYTDIEPFPARMAAHSVSSQTKNGQTVPHVANFNWDNAMDIVVSSRWPVPFNLLSMIMEIEIQGISSAGAT